MFLIPRKNNCFKPSASTRSLDDELNRFFDLALPGWIDQGGTSGPSWSPAIDILDGKNEVIIKADIPGLSKDDIKINVESNNLTIKGEKKQETERTDDGVVRTERVYGSFYRALTLPPGVDPTRVKASYKNGVLELRITKREDAQPRQIDVEVED